MKLALWILAVVVVAVVAVAIRVRTAPMDPARWHADPATAEPPATPNFALLRGSEAPVIAADVPAVAARLDGIARTEGAERLAGNAADGLVTYVVRSRIMGYPDAVSVRLSPVDGGTRVELFSRSRFGRSDLGVNAARVQRWTDALRDRTGP
ncbi:DUF1499 domain-containing protein [Rhodobacterales bacterium HKCCE2091]|nr:DUF1499 domain-containing protein [Rhodobacterales bacterium HKCCE2091]